MVIDQLVESVALIVERKVDITIKFGDTIVIGKKSVRIIKMDTYPTKYANMCLLVINNGRKIPQVLVASDPDLIALVVLGNIY